jgi:hypothetical protein
MHSINVISTTYEPIFKKQPIKKLIESKFYFSWGRFS